MRTELTCSVLISFIFNVTQLWSWRIDMKKIKINVSWFKRQREKKRTDERVDGHDRLQYVAR